MIMYIEYICNVYILYEEVAYNYPKVRHNQRYVTIKGTSQSKVRHNQRYVTIKGTSHSKIRHNQRYVTITQLASYNILSHAIITI